MRALGDVDGVTAPSSAATKSDRLTMTVVTVILIGAILLNRIGFEVGAGDSLAISLPITVAGLAVLIVCGRLEINVTRLVLYMLTAATLALVTVAKPAPFSLESILLLLVVYACFVFQFAPNLVSYRDVLNVFQNLALVCAVAGILQFVAQFAVPGPELFTFEGVIPDQFLLPGSNTVNPLYWSSPYYKSNGFFLLEPSIFSQILSIAIVVELLVLERRWRLAAYAAGMLLSYSGTGLLLLIWIVPLILLLRRQFWLIGMGVVGAVVLAVFAESLHIDIFAARAGEFHTTQSSGFLRYIAPWLFLDAHLAGDTMNFLFGRGPGTYLYYSRSMFARQVGFDPHDPTWAKLIFEYGLIGFVVFMVFILYCFFAASASPLLALGLLFGYLTFGGMLLALQYHALVLVLAILPVRGALEVVQVLPPATSWEQPMQRRVAAYRGAAPALQPPARQP
jgi:hypothetical protein